MLSDGIEGDNQFPDFAAEPTFACLSYVLCVIASSVVRADHRSDAALGVSDRLAWFFVSKPGVFSMPVVRTDVLSTGPLSTFTVEPCTARGAAVDRRKVRVSAVPPVFKWRS